MAEHGGDVTSVSEGPLNNLGYMLMDRNDIEGAIKVSITNTKAYPKSLNVWDSLAEAYLENGNRNESIACYKKALECDPNFPSAIQVLKELEAGQ